jgi:hypothetical protein
MIAEAELQEYLDEIRQEVCSRCVERPPAGPPCGPLGKPCGVEMHLAQLVEAVHHVKSDLIAPYLDTNRREVCESCPFLHSAFCPCPMDSLAVLVVQAIETVDQRRERRERGKKLVASLPGHDRPDMAEITRLYEEAAGTWTGCDWPTAFGLARLDLQDCSAEEAEARAIEAAGSVRKDWEAAACWLEEVERRAAEAEAAAEQAIKAATRGDWRDAAESARRAWSLEFSTGRPFRRQPATWQQLCRALTVAARDHGVGGPVEAIQLSIPSL